MEKNILLLVLQTGKTIIAQVEERTGAYLCTDALEVIESEQGAKLYPFIPLSNGEGIAIPTNMAIIAIPNENFAEYYSSQFNAVYVPPEPQIII